MGLAPDVFWSLTVDEFWIKHRAWMRAESRHRADLLELALRTNNRIKPEVRSNWQKSVVSMRQYPMKKWLVQPTS